MTRIDGAVDLQPDPRDGVGKRSVTFRSVGVVCPTGGSQVDGEPVSDNEDLRHVMRDARPSVGKRDLGAVENHSRQWPSGWIDPENEAFPLRDIDRSPETARPDHFAIEVLGAFPPRP